DLSDPQTWDSLPEPVRGKWCEAVVAHPLAHRIVTQRGLMKLPAPTAAIAEEYNALAVLGEDADLHVLNNWKLFTRDEWSDFCRRTAEFVKISDGDSVFEAGCGSGAFLDELLRFSKVRVAGVDIAAELVRIAQQRVPGDFRVGDVQDLSFAASGSFDKVVSHGVFLYLPCLEAARRAAMEMVRLTKPGGIVYIGLMNDPERIRNSEAAATPSGNNLIPRSFWLELAVNLGLEAKIVDQDAIYSKSAGYDGHARLRYSVLLRKSPVCESMEQRIERTLKQ
ncbi:MAG: class I SAM-dependent methyltransferase, partial [Verrucomicrobiaceae bacterium]